MGHYGKQRGHSIFLDQSFAIRINLAFLTIPDQAKPSSEKLFVAHKKQI